MCASTTAMWASLGVRELATKPGARPTSDSRLLQQTAPGRSARHNGRFRLRRKTHCPGRPTSAGSCIAACRPLPLPRPSGLWRHYT